jgi:shikimate kinase
MTAAPVVVLVGPPGAEVGAVAQALAERLGVGLVDTDAEVERAAGRPVGDVMVDDGEVAFRALERAAAGEALRSAGVVALGGGAGLDPGVREALGACAAAGAPVVFLDVTLAHAVGRLGFNRPRPAFATNPRAMWQAQMDVRRPVYDEVSTARVDTDDRTVAQVVDEVVAVLAATDQEER